MRELMKTTLGSIQMLVASVAEECRGSEVELMSRLRARWKPLFALVQQDPVLFGNKLSACCAPAVLAGGSMEGSATFFVLPCPLSRVQEVAQVLVSRSSVWRRGGVGMRAGGGWLGAEHDEVVRAPGAWEGGRKLGYNWARSTTRWFARQVREVRWLTSRRALGRWRPTFIWEYPGYCDPTVTSAQPSYILPLPRRYLHVAQPHACTATPA